MLFDLKTTKNQKHFSKSLSHSTFDCNFEIVLKRIDSGKGRYGRWCMFRCAVTDSIPRTRFFANVTSGRFGASRYLSNCTIDLITTLDVIVPGVSDTKRRGTFTRFIRFED